jgi:HD-GYP domain-containing protein (c-di-GMP phosphodiesterase class II)
MNTEIKDLTKSFKSKTKNKKERFNEFLYHCFMVFEKKIKSKKSKKLINKYIDMRNNTFKYLIANENAIIVEISK